MGGLSVKQHVLAGARDSLAQTIGLHRLDQIIHGMNLEALQSMLAVGGNKHHSGRILQALQSIGKLDAGNLGHAHIQEQNVHRIDLDLLNGLTHASGLGHHFYAADLPKKETEFGTGRSFVVYDDRVKHGVLQYGCLGMKRPCKCLWLVQRILP